MAEYQVIARKWRPQRFADLVGQEHVVRTLKNAIRQDRIAHAYLLVGPRGVGKTTTARIFAKALNCFTPQEGEPCCQCESCLAIAGDRSIDVIEIDAASRNSVDAMRELSEDARHLPVAGRYKIYIIDEVHMLSKQAWNALLKTVEEPPAHVKFIFATTEAHQVLPTIVSRCQRFDLLPIPTPLILERLRAIVDAEKVRISGQALGAIARAAEGGMRDAQSLLDQMIAFFSDEGEAEIDEDRVLSLFGLTASGDLDALALALFRDDRPGAVTLVEALARSGRNLETLLEDLLALLRGVQVASLVDDAAEVLEADAGTVERYRRLGQGVRPAVVDTLLEVLAPVGRTLRDAVNKTVFLETILFKAMREAHAFSVNDLVARLNQLRTAGELQFIDQAPALAERPLPASEASPQRTAPILQRPAAVQPPAAAAPEPETPQPVPEAAPTPASEPEVPADEATLLFRRIVDLLTQRGQYGDAMRSRWEAVEIAGFDGGKLELHVADAAADRLAMHEELPLWQQAIQDVTGDWSAMVVLTPEFTVPEAVPAVVEVPPEPLKSETEVDAVPQPAEDFEEGPVPVTAATAESFADRLQVVDDGVAAPPAEVMEKAEEPELDVEEPQAEQAAELEEELEAAADPSKRSLIGDPGAVSEAHERQAVQQALDLFGGRIVDIFG